MQSSHSINAHAPKAIFPYPLNASRREAVPHIAAVLIGGIRGPLRHNMLSTPKRWKLMPIRARPKVGIRVAAEGIIPEGLKDMSRQASSLLVRLLAHILQSRSERDNALRGVFVCRASSAQSILLIL